MAIHIIIIINIGRLQIYVIIYSTTHSNFLRVNFFIFQSDQNCQKIIENTLKYRNLYSSLRCGVSCYIK